MTMSAARLPDERIRRRAATDFEHNLVVLAGAGTGKTSLLVERALNAIGGGVVTMPQLAAITFTEKAAGELRDRLALGLDRLRALSRGDGGDAGDGEADRAYRYLTIDAGVANNEVAGRALEAMEELDRAAVMTVHGFCSHILRGHPVEADVDPGFSVDSGEQAESLRRVAWEAFLEQELGDGAKREPLWTRLLSWVALEAIGQVAQAMADFSLPEELLKPPFPTPDGRELFREDAVALAARARELHERPELTPTSTAYFQSVEATLRELAASGIQACQRRIGDDAALEKRLDGPRLSRSKKMDDELSDRFKSCFDESRRLLSLIRHIDDARMGEILEAVAPYVLEFRESFLRQGFISFDGLLAVARNLLRDHPEVRREVKQRYRMLLVDEFQDTDPLQYEIVLYLAERTTDSAADAYAAELEQGKLFVVGDAKQSIYRFRGADYAAYRRAVDRIVAAGGETLDLVSNFRSVRGVLEPVNRIFMSEEGCWTESAYQPAYVPIQAVREQGDSDARVELWSVGLEPEARAEDRREAEGRVIAEEIEKLVATGCRYSEITILFRAFSQISHYLRPLRERDIPFVVDGGKEFLERPEVSQLMAILRALSQPADAVALLAFLRSPAGGVPDDELAAYARTGGPWDWRVTEPPDGCPRIAGRFDELRGLARETRNLPADAVIRRVLDRTRLLPLGAAAFEGAQRVANLRKLASAAGDLARDGKLSLEEVVEGLREGRLLDIKTDRPLADDAADAVRITSIHRMKGLENAWILLPDLARGAHRSRSEGNRVDLARPPREPAALAVRAGGLVSSTAAWLDRAERGHGHSEEVRVLYVALTRARERLVLLLGPSRQRSPWIEALAPWGYDPDDAPGDGGLLLDGQVVHRTKRPRRSRRRSVPRELGGTEDAVRSYETAVALSREAAKPRFATPSGRADEGDPDAGPVPLRTVGPARQRDLGRAVGVVVHRWLEAWPGTGAAGHREALDKLSVGLADALGIDADALTKEAGAVVDRFLASELAARLDEIDVVGREVPILLRAASGETFRGSIDLLYKDVDGTWVVADYKTDRETDPEELRGRYAAQLAIYASAVREAFQLLFQPRKELWSLTGGTRVVVE